MTAAHIDAGDTYTTPNVPAALLTATMGSVKHHANKPDASRAAHLLLVDNISCMAYRACEQTVEAVSKNDMRRHGLFRKSQQISELVLPCSALPCPVNLSVGFSMTYHLWRISREDYIIQAPSPIKKIKMRKLLLSAP